MPLGAHKAAMMGTAGVSTADIVLLATTTASDNSVVEFTLPTAYKFVEFSFYNCLPETDGEDFKMNLSADGGSSYPLKTSTFFAANHTEADDKTSVHYEISDDLAQGAGDQTLSRNVGSAADEGCSGVLTLFNPTSTTYTKHWISRSPGTDGARAWDNFGGGYSNTTTALNEIRFLYSSGNIAAGKIKMWGVK